MKIYKNSILTEEVKFLDLGIVMAGDKKDYEYFIYNDTEAKLVDLQFNIPHHEVAIKKAPTTLEAKASSNLVISWSPSINLKQGLKVEIMIKGFEIWS